MSCNSSLPAIGTALPEFSAQTTQGTLTRPMGASTRWLILFSYIGDFTPVCTTEICSFQKRLPAFTELECDIVGLSTASVDTHLRWNEWMKEKTNFKIQFPLIADEQGELAKKLGIYDDEKGCIATRATLFVDPAGIVRMSMYYPAEVGRDMDEVIRALKALQTADSMKCGMPANWPRNGLVGDHILLAPAKDEQTGRQTLANTGGFDWWFCHKSI